MIKRSLFLIATLVFIFSGCGVKEYKLFQTENKELEKTTIIDEKTYNEEVVFENIIAPNDRVDITVYIQAGEGNQQMTSMLTSRDTNTNNATQENIGLLVTQDGTVRLPLIGSFKVAGYTQDQASDILIQEYKKYIRNPYVLVEIKNQRVIVIGEVKSPGIVHVTNGTMNIIEAIARSGDVTDLASRSDIKVIRGDLRNPEIRNVDLTRMDAVSLSSLYLKPNDILYIQPREIKGYNRVFTDFMPFWDTLSSILTPFVQSKVLIQ